VDGGDAVIPGVAGVLEFDRSALDEDPSAVGVINAGHDFDRGRFSGAVLADQGRDLARVQRETHVLQRLDAHERLTNAVQRQRRGSPHFRSPPSAFHPGDVLGRRSGARPESAPRPIPA